MEIFHLGCIVIEIPTSNHEILQILEMRQALKTNILPIIDYHRLYINQQKVKIMNNHQYFEYQYRCYKQ